MTKRSQPGVPVRVFDAATTDDLGIVHMPLPVEIGDRLAVADQPYEVVDLIPTGVGAKIAALVQVRPIVLERA